MKKTFLSLMVFMMIIGLIPISTAFAATLGNSLPTPEAGWQRFDDRHESIDYIGSGWQKKTNSAYYNNTRAESSKTTLADKVHFNFQGTKVRIIGGRFPDYSPNIKITIDGNIETFSETNTGGEISKALVYEKTGLVAGVHTVEIQKLANGSYAVDLIIDAIDIDDTGSLLPLDSTAPAAPIGLAATAGANQIVLNWTANSEADLQSYKIYQNGVYISTINKPAATYTASGLTNGTTYSFQITAVDTSGNESVKSNVVSATPLAPIPSAPTNVTAQAGNAQVSLSWSSEPFAIQYHIKRSTSPNGTYTTIGTVTSLTYTDVTVSNGVTYYYVVAAVSSGGESANSNPVSATPNAPIILPGTPLNLVGQAASFGNELIWEASANAISYRVKRSLQSGGPYDSIAYSVAGITYSDSAVIPGTVYYYVVSAVNADGESGNSNEVAITVPSEPKLDVLITESKIRIGDEVTSAIVLRNVSNIYAEDFTVSYDSTLFDYIGFEEIPGYKVYNTPAVQNGTVRFIVASQGQAYGVNGEAVLLKLKWRAKAEGTAKVDATKCRIADTVHEFDLTGASCGEDTVVIEGYGDVNKSGEYTLLDLAIDSYYYGQLASNTPSNLNANQAGDDQIRDEDLLFIVAKMLQNANYTSNK